MAIIEDSVSGAVTKSVRDNVISNDIFWKRNENFLLVLKPVADAILILESDHAVLSDCINQYNTMSHKIEANLAQSPLTKAK